MNGYLGGDTTGSTTIVSNATLTLGNNAGVTNGTLNANGATTFGTNFTVGGGGTATFYLNASSTGQTNLTVAANGIFEYQTLSSTTVANLTGLTINNGGILRHKTNSTTYTNALDHIS